MMKVYQMNAPRTIVAEDRNLPTLSDHEVMVKVTNIGLCGSDLHIFKGDYNGPSQYPILFGHEWSGIVASVGSRVSDLSAGDKVTGDCSKYCGTCPTCMTDKNLCTQIEKFGITTDGASAEYIVRDWKYLYHVDNSVDLALLSLAEPIAVAKHLIEKIRLFTGELSGKRILVYGGGPIGQSVLLMLQDIFGCKNVEMLDIIESRIDLGIANGAIRAKIDDPDDSDQQAYASLYQNTIYDVIIETTGVPDVFARSISLLRPMGILGCLGMSQKVEIPQSQIVTKSLRIIGSIGGTGEFDDVIRYIRDNPVKVAKLISHRFHISEFAKAFETANLEPDSMKINLFM